MPDRLIVLATNNRHSLRGISQISPQEFLAVHEDDDNLTYTIDMTAYLDGATISSVTRTASGTTVSNTSNTTTRVIQRLKGEGYVDFEITTSTGDVEKLRISIAERTTNSNVASYS